MSRILSWGKIDLEKEEESFGTVGKARMLKLRPVCFFVSPLIPGLLKWTEAAGCRSQRVPVGISNLYFKSARFRLDWLTMKRCIQVLILTNLYFRRRQSTNNTFLRSHAHNKSHTWLFSKFISGTPTIATTFALRHRRLARQTFWAPKSFQMADLLLFSRSGILHIECFLKFLLIGICSAKSRIWRVTSREVLGGLYYAILASLNLMSRQISVYDLTTRSFKVNWRYRMNATSV